MRSVEGVEGDGGGWIGRGEVGKNMGDHVGRGIGVRGDRALG